MTTDELDHALRQLRLGGMADTLSGTRATSASRQPGAARLSRACSFTTSCNRRRDRFSRATRLKLAAFRDQKNARYLRLEV